jgi:hypothetical protein
VKSLGLTESNNKDEALEDLFTRPANSKGYTIWWGLDGNMSPQEGDALLRKVVIETIISQPRILRYYIWNFWTFLFGPPMVPEVSCVKCECPPCFAANLPGYNVHGFMGAEVFHKVAGPRVISQMAAENKRAMVTAPYARLLHADVRQLFVVKPLLTLLLLASIFLTRGKTRFVMLYCSAVVLIIGGTTALAWPAQARYQLPILPYVLAGASVSIFEIIRRVRDFAHSRAAGGEAAA